MADRDSAAAQDFSEDRSPRRSQSPQAQTSSHQNNSSHAQQNGRDDRGRNSEQGSNPGNNLHVSGLSTRVEDRDLEEVFSKYGQVEKCQVMRDPHSKESRGFAFVTMVQNQDAEQAIIALNATELMGRTMNVEKARRARARTPTPGQYHGPPKREMGGMSGAGGYRPYEPRGGPMRGGYDDRRGGPPPGYGYGGYPVPFERYPMPDRMYDERDRYDRGYAAGYPDRYPPPRGYEEAGYAIPMRQDDRRESRRYEDSYRQPPRREDARRYDDSARTRY